MKTLNIQNIIVPIDFSKMSVQAIQIAKRLARRFGASIHLAHVRQFNYAADFVAPAPPIVPIPRNGPAPLSFAQQRLWLIDQLEPGNPAYNLPAAVRLSGELSVDLLAQIFAEVVRRHEALRTTFEPRAGEPVQVIAPTLRPELPVVELDEIVPGRPAGPVA